MTYDLDVLVFRDGKHTILVGPPGSIHTRSLLKAGTVAELERHLRKLIREHLKHTRSAGLLTATT
jgi:hypothetical protein